MTSATLLEMSALDAVAAMRRGALSAERYAAALLEQCERAKALNAFITLHADQVLETARAADLRLKSDAKLGPLHGLPVPIKDSINTKNLRTTAGTQALREFQPAMNAPIVQVLEDAGAIILGKTNLHELSMGWTSNNYTFGPVRNPYDQTRIPGGSSGGTAAAVAARMAPLGVAEDTEGSIRVPAALCGIAGFRPTMSRYPSAGTAPISALFDQVGPHARTVADLILFDSVVTGNHEAVRPVPLKGLKLGVARGYWFTGLDAEVARVTEQALTRLQDAGVQLVEAEVPDLAALVQLITGVVQVHDVFTELPKYLRASGAEVTFQQVIAQSSPELKAFFAEFGKGGRGFVTEPDYRMARDIYLPRLRQTFHDYFARTGAAAIVFPTTLLPATLIPDRLIGQDEHVMIGDKQVSFITAIARNIAPGSTAGLPGLVLPSGMTRSGLPVSLELDGPSGADRELLGLGMSVEAVLGRLPSPQLGSSSI